MGWQTRWCFDPPSGEAERLYERLGWIAWA